ncbi:iron ABC transporter permease protein [methanogenic archaeon mixed culture ISO4-G1]|nr:iron ABC transporter permease protein [methanogenic archaeon mixed culture ISO4-G1]
MDGDERRHELTRIIRNDIDTDTFQGKYDAGIRKKILFILSMVAVTIVVAIASICLGATDIPLEDLFRVFFHPLFPDWVPEPSHDYYYNFVYNGRLPRLVLIILTGVSLGAAGMMMQAVLRNPLVSPFTLGVSTAASFGAALAILLGDAILGASAMGTAVDVIGTSFSVSDLFRVVMAFLVALLSIWLVLIMSRRGSSSRSLLILSGVVISYLFQAGIMSSKYFSNDEQLREITLWIMGSMANASWGADLIIFPVVTVCLIFLFKQSMDLNALSAGDEVASSLGVDVDRLRKRTLVLCTLMSAVCLAFTGVIGFIGLMAPHICRMIIGNDARYLMPASTLMGIVVLSISDLFCRLIIRPGELPTGIVLYLIGGLFFIWLVSNRKWGSRL